MEQLQEKKSRLNPIQMLENLYKTKQNKTPQWAHQAKENRLAETRIHLEIKSYDFNSKMKNFILLLLKRA